MASNEKTDHGVLAVCNCPHCNEGKLHIVTKYRSLWFFKVDAAMSVSCESCTWSLPINHYEENKAKRLLKSSQAFLDGSLNEEEWRSRIVDADLNFVNDLLGGHETWTCADCGEHSPVTFANCWQCGAASPVPPQQADIVAEENLQHRDPTFGDSPMIQTDSRQIIDDLKSGKRDAD
jgi:hypothetical protein